ncbi:MAG: Mrp/NBP35 family ATP-binding protein [Fibrobacter sp.]|nr:Mrp/NBP35 family ATP-binding protein [Fibrobacter sp.]
MELNEKNILKALCAVQDPDLHKNIVELDFVQNLKIEGTKVSFDLRLTTPTCPIRDQFKDQCIAIVKAMGATEVNVTFTAKEGGSATGNSATQAPKDSHIGEVAHVVAVASGKGGVGKSTVTANLAMALSLSGARVGILDADIYGPSMGLMFGIDKAPEVFDDNTIAPVEAKGGISIVSMCMFADSDKATIWRGPMVSQMIQHFIHHVRWGKLDYLLVDFPPGTGDIQLTLTQNCPMAGAVVVTTPQEVALADCRKGIAMFDNVGVPVIGIVENMSYFICDQCNKPHYIFRQGGGESIAKKWGVPLMSKVPLEPAVADCGDAGIPAVLKYPNSESAKAFMNAADQMVRNLSILEAEGEGVLKSFNYGFDQLPVEEV